jgi:hypothetical protein
MLITLKFGFIALFGSGEIAPHGRKVHEWIMKHMKASIKVSILETPAGFQPNSAIVARKIEDFLKKHLVNFQPEVYVIPARKKMTPFSPDRAEILSPVLNSNYIFLGPGSPTYAVKQLQNSLLWSYVLAKHATGAALVMASAATIAAGLYSLPVYEIYKAGEELYWHKGLNFFGNLGLNLVFMPHWNNTEGGKELDTSCCFIGRERFKTMMGLLPSIPVIGIDEHTALIIDLEKEEAFVSGLGGVTLIKDGKENFFPDKTAFPFKTLGSIQRPDLNDYVSPSVWEDINSVNKSERDKSPEIHEGVSKLVIERETSRKEKNWAESDRLREEILSLGWHIRDTEGGPELVPGSGN